MTHFAETAEQSIHEIAEMLAHMATHEITDGEWDRCEPRIRISYGDYTINLPNLAQTYNGLEAGLQKMFTTIIECGC